LVEALAERDGVRAADLMEQHLAHVEHLLDFRQAGEAPPDSRSIFAK
jgi:DNA-binding GntR family transcriptional regulator